ncbi:MAG TPA: ThuA domain-containing protein [Candidatus Hydrogenedentes bacterium]|nr:ThuA domain-containing protein [Candidatus Hydrogenedentota bacterium]HRK34422.1 ThuA domain-containing protein [Candidatus Hydrogenedentota bacterium]
MKRIAMIAAAALAATVPANAVSKAIFLSKSSGFEHSCIKWDENKVSHVDRILTKLAPQFGSEVLCTKDASLINAENLKNYKLVIFYTTLNLDEEGADKNPPMKPSGQAELIEWIKNGGGFVGFHCASDTFHTPDGGEVTPYIKMIGGEFRGHGKQFVGTVRVVDKAHPTMANVPEEWSINDEWYLFKNLNEKSIHVLATLDSAAEREVQEMYNIPNYPIIWCSELGKGRVFYNAMGHREDVWDSEIFQKSVVDAAKWAMGEGPANAAPNLEKVMTPDEIVKVQLPPVKDN